MTPNSKCCTLSSLTTRIATLERRLERVPREPGLANRHSTLTTKAYAEELLRDFVDCLARSPASVERAIERMSLVTRKIRPLYTTVAERHALNKYEEFVRRARSNVRHRETRATRSLR